MQQAKFSVKEDQISFLNEFLSFGFKDKSSMVRVALELLRKKLELHQLKKSAALYSELYESDEDAHEWTNTAMSDWPK